jgi:DNA-binding MarR family transcriptional regulator
MRRPRRTFYIVKELESAIRTQLEELLKEFNITIAQYTTMNRLRDRDARSSSQLARAHRVSAQTMNEMMAGLEARGLVSRTEDPDNRRVLLISLTPAGVDVLSAADRHVDRLEETFFDCLSSAELKTLRKLVEKVTDHVHLVDA